MDLTRRAKVRVWLRKHHLVTHVLITVAIVTPGYLRIESIVQSIIDARSDARVVSCADSNEFAFKYNAGLTYAFQPQPGDPPRSSADQAQADLFLSHLLVPVRDCTPAAIEKHYKERQP